MGALDAEHQGQVESQPRNQPAGKTQTAWRRIAVSTVLVVVVGLQAASGSGVLFYGANLERSETWPFLDYGMFREAHFIGESEVSWGAEVTLESDERFVVTPFGPARWESAEPRDLMHAYREREDAAIKAWCDAVREETGQEVTGLDWFESSYLLKRDGFKVVNRRKLGSHPLPEAP